MTHDLCISEARKQGYTVHQFTPYHYGFEYDGANLSYWPTRGKWMDTDGQPREGWGDLVDRLKVVADPRFFAANPRREVSAMHDAGFFPTDTKDKHP